MKSISIDQITAAGLSILELKQQKTEVNLDGVCPPLTAGPSSLVFVSTEELLHTAVQRNAQALILSETLYSHALSIIPKNTTIWTTKNVQAAMSVILPLFDKVSEHLKPGKHPTAVIHPSAKVAASAHIGAYAVIEAFAEIGESTIIFPFVYVGSFCRIGNRCRLSPHVTVGSDGFGFYTDKTFSHHKIPQIGNVVIEDDCEFGAHCAIDRATLTETKIKKGSKFDNFCHIAHNVQIGENAMITAGFIVAGSTVIGKNLMTSGGTHVLGHLTVADNVILGPRAGVLQSIEKSGMYGGYPLEPYKESVKTLLSLPQVKKLRKQVSKILKQLNITEEE